MLSDNLKILIDELGISQRRFALDIGVDPGYISKILNNKIPANKRMLILIENVYNVNRDWLETGDGEMFKSKEVLSVKSKVIDMIESLDESQIDSVAAFLKFLQQK